MASAISRVLNNDLTDNFEGLGISEYDFSDWLYDEDVQEDFVINFPYTIKFNPDEWQRNNDLKESKRRVVSKRNLKENTLDTPITKYIENDLKDSIDSSKAIYFVRKPYNLKEVIDSVNTRNGYLDKDKYTIKLVYKSNITNLDELDAIVEHSGFKGGGDKYGRFVMAVVDDNVGTYLIDPQGFDYARYVGFIPNKDNVSESLKENKNSKLIIKIHSLSSKKSLVESIKPLRSTTIKDYGWGYIIESTQSNKSKISQILNNLGFDKEDYEVVNNVKKLTESAKINPIIREAYKDELMKANFINRDRIKESLDKIDFNNDNKYDLRMLYESTTYSDDEIAELEELVDTNADEETIHKFLMSKGNREPIDINNSELQNREEFEDIFTEVEGN